MFTYNIDLENLKQPDFWKTMALDFAVVLLFWLFVNFLLGLVVIGPWIWMSDNVAMEVGRSNIQPSYWFSVWRGMWGVAPFTFVLTLFWMVRQFFVEYERFFPNGR